MYGTFILTTADGAIFGTYTGFTAPPPTPPAPPATASVAPPDFRTLTFGLPLCSNHARLLALGCELLDFQPGL